LVTVNDAGFVIHFGLLLFPCLEVEEHFGSHLASGIWIWAWAAQLKRRAKINTELQLLLFHEDGCVQKRICV